MGFSGEWFCPSCTEKSLFHDVTCVGGWMICKCPVCKMRFQVYIPDLRHQLRSPNSSDNIKEGRMVQEW